MTVESPVKKVIENCRLAMLEALWLPGTLHPSIDSSALDPREGPVDAFCPEEEETSVRVPFEELHQRKYGD